MARLTMASFVIGVLESGTPVASALTKEVVSGEEGVTSTTTGSDGLTKTGSGTLVIWSAQNYTGATVISAGQIMLAGDGAISANSALQIDSGASINLTGYYAANNINRTFAGLTGGGILYGGGGSVTINKASGTDTFAGGVQGAQTLIKTGAGTLSLSGNNNSYSGGTLISGGTLKILSGGAVGNNITNNATLNFDGAHGGIANVISGTGSLVKSGEGMAVLYSASTYTGATVVSGGQLMLGGAGSISSSSGLEVAAGASVNLTGYYAADNINRTINGLTGAGTVYGGGGTLTVNKAASTTDIYYGDITGGTGLIKSGDGTLALAAASAYTGETTVSGGVLLLANGNGLGSTNGGTTVASGAVLRLTNATGITVGNEALTISGQGRGGSGGALRSVGGTNTWQGKVSLAAASTIGAAGGSSLTLDVASGNAIEANNHNLTFDGAGTNRINDAIALGTGGLTKIGSGRAILAGNNSYSGATTVNLGALEVASGGSISSSSTAVNSGGTLEVAGTAGSVQLNSGGLLKGSGTVGALSVASGGTLAPGNSTGILNTGSTTFLGGGNYDWEIDNFTGSVGNSWDFLNIAGDLTISANSGSQFIIDVISLLSTNDTAGLASNFNDGTNYTFAIATASGTINGYAANAFSINTSAFQNSFTGTWGTSLSADGKSLNITYTGATAIPEPSTVSLLVLGFAVVLQNRRRQSKSLLGS